MSGRHNWSRIEQERKMAYVPSQRTKPVTQKQIDFIIGLAYQKGQPKPRLPKTMKGASDLIERLMAMPDVNERKNVRLAPVQPVEEKPSTVQEMVVELRERFPVLTPMAANSLIQLFSVIDPIGTAFALDVIIREDAPEDRDKLIIHLIKRFIEAFDDITANDSSLV